MAKPLKVWRVTCAYGVKGSRWASGVHKGIDGAATIGTPVYAAVAGTVTGSSWGRAFGIHVVVANAKFANGDAGLFAGYCHLTKTVVKAGQKVRKGQLLGYSGVSGNVSGPHLHFEVQKASNWSRVGHVNPQRWLEA